ncbi:MAG TPA: sigma-54-dependent Fis family transcriptional regulator [Gammaproteobacteria bacterium]|nr:sigma-54-dependent Fis family transcriptional regulator [Gammaproteobacteria bacterium]
MSAAHILVVDDEEDIRILVKDILEDEGYSVAVAENGAQARAARRSRRPDLVLLDIWMPDVDGISLLKEWNADKDHVQPVIMMSGHGTVETAVEATRLGAYDFIEKPLSMAKLLLSVSRALEAARLASENQGLRRHARPLTEPLGRSAAMETLRDQIRRVAQHEARVLIQGEPGSGKELCARYLHALSPRAQGPFVEVGAAVLMRENPAAELFGAEQDGRIRYGLLEQAAGGTVFFDEVGDMDLTLQARLFGALESGACLRVGGVEPVALDVRIIAATRRDLAREVQARRFREDLYYLLSIVPLRVPALREHSEDVPELLEYYLDFFVVQEGLPYRPFTVAAQNRLRHYPWPGNVRELKNLVQRLLILGGDHDIDADELDKALSGTTQNGAPETVGGFDLPLREARERFEKAYLEYQLKLAGGSVGRVAKQVGLERTHLYRKLRALGINTKAVRKSSDEGALPEED